MIVKARAARRKSAVERQVPSPAAIRRAAAEIRSHWTRHTALKRAGETEFSSAVIELPSAPRRKGFVVE